MTARPSTPHRATRGFGVARARWSDRARSLHAQGTNRPDGPAPWRQRHRSVLPHCWAAGWSRA